MRLRVALVSLTLLWFPLAGCENEAPKPAASASTTATTSAPAAAPSLAPIEKPKPLDLAALQKALGCSGKAGSGPCPVLEHFAKCKEGWSPITQSGDGRWIGEGSIVKKGQFIEDFIVVRGRRVGTAEVAPGALGVKVAIDRIPDDEPEARGAAGPAVRALVRGDVVKKGNRALLYIEERSEWSEAYAQNADGNQVFVATGAGAFMCGDVTSQALHIVRLSGTREHPADGIYATLYPVKW